MPRKDAEARREYQREYGRKWRKANPDKVRGYNNSEARREYARRYYQANREKVLARQQERRDTDPEYRRKKAEQAARWAQEHPEQARTTRRRYWAKRKYGLTLEEYEAILERGCAICGSHAGRVVGARGKLPGKPEPRLCLDHDRASGKVRAALCHSCNSALGLFGDDPNRLRAAADYIELHRK